MVQWIAERDAWFNTRLVCWECNETTWKQNEAIHMRISTIPIGFTPIVRWWTCKECWN